MANGNGNAWIIKTLVGFMFTILFFSVTTLASNMITNNKDSRLRGTERDNKISVVEADIREINTHIAYIKDSMSEQKVMQQRVLDKLDTLG